MAMKNCIVIDEDGVAQKVTVKTFEAGEIQNALYRVSQSGFHRIDSVFMVDGQPVTMALNNNGVTLAAVQLRQLPITTNYMLNDSVLNPCWATLTDGVRMTCIFVPPDNMKLWLTVELVSIEKRTTIRELVSIEKRTTIRNVLIYAQAAGQTGYFRLPLPNIHTDSRLCPNREHEEWANHLTGENANNIELLLKKAIRHVVESVWNKDLAPANSATRQIFSFDPQTLTNQTIPSEWWTSCQRVSRLEMEVLHAN